MTDRPDARLRIYVFSYNRARFLKNCVDSVTTLAPDFELVIIDDHSDERSARKLLNKLSVKHKVLRPTAVDGRQTFKTGGLYANKNVALADAEQAGAKYALYMHDDQQLVRPIREQDLARFDRYFQAHEKGIELHVCFMKMILRESDEQFTEIDNTQTAYFRSKEGAKGHKYFSGSGVFDVARVRKRLGEFALGEKPNEAIARDLDAMLGFYAWPFMTWLPFPISYRGKKRRLAHWMMEWLGGGGFHPITYMPQDSETAFLERPLSERPVAENFLDSPTAPKAKYWSTMGGFYNASARRGLRRNIARLIWKRTR